ncbi:alpha/beta-hydrolase [Rickenella mellea]|uniref:Alpha/beta-hydrolase n=1 Tax=Rickenella mellea TaxID=50990 RepID=A0A4Y7Q330_9AGAM|nr:alpha/beta-hydrolase [Rickenella mellea]
MHEIAEYVYRTHANIHLPNSFLPTTSADKMSLCKGCISGVRHEGIPEGRIEKIGGYDTYVALPTADYPKDKAVLFFTDVFGAQFVNNQLLADDFARNGFQVYMPDYFHGDGLPANAMNDDKFDRAAWMAKHAPETAKPVVDAVVNALKEKGITRFGTLGYCYGAIFVFSLGIENITHVSVVAHPSRIAVPDDLQKYKAHSQAPLLINSCEVDRAFPQEAQKAADDILGDGKFAPGYERTYWEGCEHGFAVRGDMSNPKVKAGKEGAFKASVEFLLKL